MLVLGAAGAEEVSSVQVEDSLETAGALLVGTAGTELGLMLGTTETVLVLRLGAAETVLLLGTAGAELGVVGTAAVEETPLETLGTEVE